MGSGDPSEAHAFVIWGVGLKADSGQEGGSTSTKIRPKAYCLVLLSSPMTVAKTYGASSPGQLMICSIKHVIIRGEQEKYTYKEQQQKREYHPKIHHGE